MPNITKVLPDTAGDDRLSWDKMVRNYDTAVRSDSFDSYAKNYEDTREFIKSNVTQASEDEDTWLEFIKNAHKTMVTGKDGNTYYKGGTESLANDLIQGQFRKNKDDLSVGIPPDLQTIVSMISRTLKDKLTSGEASNVMYGQNGNLIGVLVNPTSYHPLDDSSIPIEIENTRNHVKAALTSDNLDVILENLARAYLVIKTHPFVLVNHSLFSNLISPII